MAGTDVHSWVRKGVKSVEACDLHRLAALIRSLLTFINCRSYLMPNGGHKNTKTIVKSSVFWNKCSPLKMKRCFRGKFRLYLQDRRISSVWKQNETSSLLRGPVYICMYVYMYEFTMCMTVCLYSTLSKLSCLYKTLNNLSTIIILLSAQFDCSWLEKMYIAECWRAWSLLKHAVYTHYPRWYVVY
jgi:hypothetical protein